MAKSLEVRKIFHFCVFIPIEVFKNQEDCPNYLALKDHSILTNQKCLEEIFFKLCFKKRGIVTPGSGPGYSLYNGPIRGRGLCPKGLLLQVYEKVKGFH